MNTMTPFSSKALLLLFFSHLTFSQVLINEICSSNQQVTADEDGDYSDWIELYNAGTTSVDIENYSISDNLSFPRKFILPSTLMAPGEHVLLWASDKNRKRKVDHWETIIFDSDVWKYKIPESNIDGWTSLGFDDSSWPEGKGGFGFGDDDDSTIVPSSTITVYMRKTFTVTNLLSIAEMVLHLDYDDGFVVWLNGTRVTGRNLSAIPAYNELAADWHEAILSSGGIPELFFLDESLLVTGTNVLCVEIHNTSSSSDLSCRPFLSVGMRNPQTEYRTPPQWFSLSKTIPTHTNFKISEGETIVLTNQSAVVIDSKIVPSVLHSDQSYGRKPSGGTEWNMFPTPTPYQTNQGNSFLEYCNDSIVFSHAAGYYEGPQTIALSGSSQIRYTIDGSEPDASSPLYSAPIPIIATKVVKAICYTPESFPEKSYVNTYFIDENPDLPVWSLSTNPSHFFNYNTGIYVKGPNAEPNSPYFGANFWQNWERPIYAEYFETDRQRKISQHADVRIYGNWSRANGQKSLLLKGKDKYDINRFNYQFYPDKPLSSFEDIVLRNSGSDYNVTHFRDGFIQSVIGQFTSLDYQAYRPAIIFLNGEYWGIQNIREKIGADFICENHSVNLDDIDIGETWGNTIEGNANIWGLHQRAMLNDLRNESNFRLVADSFDLQNMIDYFASEIYISNWDWPHNNVKYWRNRKTDNKYKYILWDTDISLGLFDLQTPSYDALDHILHGDTLGPHADIFQRMLQNVSFRNSFINRSADMMNSVFAPASFRAKALAYADSINTEISRHFQRWPALTVWEQSVSQMVNFIDQRQVHARNQIQSNFDLSQQIEITLNVLPAGAGVIRINSIYPDIYPWNGVYYEGVPVTITAIPNPGYTFSYWQSPGQVPSPVSDKTILLNLTTAETLTAYFSGTAQATGVIVSEINYNSHASTNSGDWIELHNYTNSPVDLTGWSIRDGIHYHRYSLPDNTVIPANGRLVIAEDTSLFHSVYPEVTNVTGPLGFGLSADGEAIHLLKPGASSYKSFSYGTNAPWPTQPNGNGYTLELTSTAANQNNSSSWTIGCPGGSPGSELVTPCVTSVQTIAKTSEIKIYPNPSKGIVELTLPGEQGEWKIEALDIMGAVQHSQQLENSTRNFRIDLSDLKSGVYILKASQEEKSYQARIVIVR